MKAHDEWTTEELWKHEQLNFAAHMAIMFDYLEQKGLPVDDFVTYTAEKVIPGWRDGVKHTTEDFMRAILLNVLANGGEVFETGQNGDERTAKVSYLLNTQVMQAYGSPPEMTGKFWDKFTPIAEAIGMTFSWEHTDDDRYLIRVSN